MRTEDEIRAMRGTIEFEDFAKDDFKSGMIAGKLEALEWVLGEVRSGALQVGYDFEDWQRECRHAAGQIPPIDDATKPKWGATEGNPRRKPPVE